MEYLIELHNVSFEIGMYIADLSDFGEITRYCEQYPTYVWLSSSWEKDILESIHGVKQVWPKR